MDERESRNPVLNLPHTACPFWGRLFISLDSNTVMGIRWNNVHWVFTGTCYSCVLAIRSTTGMNSAGRRGIALTPSNANDLIHSSWCRQCLRTSLLTKLVWTKLRVKCELFHDLWQLSKYFICQAGKEREWPNLSQISTLTQRVLLFYVTHCQEVSYSLLHLDEIFSG